MNATLLRSIREVQLVAIEIARSASTGQGHGAAWGRVARATTLEELLVSLGYSAGYAECALIGARPASFEWRLADCLGNAAKTFAALLRSPSPVDVGRCVRVYRQEIRELIATVPATIAVTVRCP